MSGFGFLNRPVITGGSITREDGVMSKRIRFFPEVKERAVRMLLEHQDEYPSQGQAICSIVSKTG